MYESNITYDLTSMGSFVDSNLEIEYLIYLILLD